MRGWPGEYRSPKTDEEISKLYREGKVTPVLQAGGVPFEARRIPGSASDRQIRELRDRLSRPIRRDEQGRSY